MSGKTIITYLIDGSPFGIKTVEFSNRLILGISIPRKDFEISRSRKELERSGIYFLIGEEENGNPLVYMGQATFLGKRLTDHYRDTKKDFWNVAVAFTAKDGTLNESDINYLERELIQEANKIGRYKVINNTSGNNGLIQPNRISDMEEYIADLKILLSSLGFPVLQDLAKKDGGTNENKNIFYLKSRGSNAQGIYTEEGFVLLKGSTISPQEIIPYQKNLGYIERRRNELREKGILIGDVFSKDCVFKTPTAACNTVAGGNQNGWIEWKTEDGETLDQKMERK